MSDDDAAQASATSTDWKSVGSRTFAKFLGDQGPDLAAALTYYSMMSIFPMILAISTSLSFLGQGGATNDAIADLGGELGMDDSTIETVQSYLESMSRSDGAGVLLVIGLLGSLWSASNYVNAFSRMMNVVYDTEEGRPVWKLRPWLLLVTVVVMLMLMLIVLSVTLSGTIAEAVFGIIGLSGTATTVWNIAKWPVILVILMTIVGLLYWGTPNVRQPTFLWLSPGAVLAVLTSIVAGAGFFLYAMNSGSYNATYGALGGVIILLLMVWLINVALVLGAELDAEIERGRQLAAGMAAEEDILLPPRDLQGTAKKREKEDEMVRAARERRMRAADELEADGEPLGLEGRGAE
ncbi:YihY/virulence factor BrkB family protein [Serinicoccus sp. LYQ131]|uniref:YihY/virulence factor BrkB family protein n=1 Tax=Serinicoccus sp. LYQ131 TaxID=3378797 RepID=UPI003853DCB4